jgi:hypothetical protein
VATVSTKPPAKNHQKHHPTPQKTKPPPAHLVPRRRQQPLVAQQLDYHGVPKPKPGAGRVVAAKGAQQLVVAPAAADGAQLAGAVKALEYDAFVFEGLGGLVSGFRF